MLNIVPWLQLVESLAPPILAIIPGFPATLIPIIIAAIQATEKLPWLTGAEKKAIVMKAVSLATIDPTKTEAVSKAIDATIHAANTAVAQAIPSIVVNAAPTTGL